MLWSIDSCQTGYPLTTITWPYRGLKCRPIEVEYFLKLSADKSPVSNDRRLKFIYSNNSYKICCVYVIMAPALLGFWVQTDLGRENSASFLKIQSGKTSSYHGHAFVTLYVQFLCSDWSIFDSWAHAENLCSILKVAYFDSWSWQSFVSACDVFNCLFRLDVQNEIQPLSRVFCYSWLVCFFGFWLRNASLVKIR